ncbi:NACHT domain-containing protein [Leptolyngbya sp. AN03gr2]|uniref:NACHT domain-containing protein n=1 Tax=unclassified Leptolyngbya TaxID=2650499 RepID=UPI003D320771
MTTYSLSEKGLKQVQTALAVHNLTITKLANNIDVSRATVNSFLQRKPVRANKAQLIASYLQLNLSDIISASTTNEETVSIVFRQTLIRALVQRYHTATDWFRISIMSRPQQLSSVYIEPDQYRMSKARRGSRSILTQKAATSILETGSFRQIEPERTPVRIKPGDHTLIVGNSGIGKTALLKRLTQQALLSPERPTLPFLIDLDDFEAEKCALQFDVKIIEQVAQLTSTTVENVEKQVITLLQSGEIWLLLDNLDQVQNSRSIVTAIKTFACKYPNTTIVVASRLPHFFWVESFNVVELAGFSLDQIHQFVYQWFSVRGIPEASEQFIAQLGDCPVLQEFCTAPAMLILFVNLFEESPSIQFKDCQESWVDLALRFLIRDWDHSQGKWQPISPLFSNDHSLSVWRQIAKQLSPQQPLFSSKEVKAALVGYFRTKPQVTSEWIDQINSDEFVTMTQLRTGLIEERYSDLYSFRFWELQQLLAEAD